MTPAEVFDRLTPTVTRRVPVATYRLQLGPGLGFDDAADLAPYLDALGITDCYTSPFFATATPASHGYDVADHNRLREDLGGEAAFLRFAEALKRAGLGLIIDIVPNHMGIASGRNAWWWSVLEHGAGSPYAGFFDIDWAPVKRELAGKVLLPILGDHYGTVLDAGQLCLELDGDRFLVRYHDRALPVAPESYPRVLGHRLDDLQQRLGAEHADVVALKSVIAWFASLPARTESERDHLVVRVQEVERGRRQLAELLARSGDIRHFVGENVRRFNGTPGEATSFDLLDELLDKQHYRLAFWRVAGEEINYRRFFDINELAAIRMEDPTVFAAAHRLVFRLVGDGIVTGLRIDHPDGLYAPAEYLQRLQRGCFLALGRRLAGVDGGGAAPGWRDEVLLASYDEAAARSPAPLQPFYILAEKILAAGEPLPEWWPVAGTTGYEFLNVLHGIFVDRTQARAVEAIYARLLRRRVSFADLVYHSKRLIMETSMASELNMLGHRLNIISEKHRSSRDFTLGSLTRALREIIACFPVYRTYVGETGGTARAGDREAVARAVASARARRPAINASVFDWIAEIIMGRVPAGATERDRRERADFLARFQQITGPVTAKGYEDTALYRYHRLTSLNEVGGDPSRFGASIAEFHAAAAARRRHTPDALSATATHDTKRGEDVRARISVLSAIPHEWRRRLARWQRLNRRHRTTVDGQPVPGPNEEYLIYQTLVGAWPIAEERLREYLLKAIHEAKEWTSWINPNPRYDEAVTGFAAAILDPRRARAFLRDFTEFQAEVARFGVLNSLAQLVIKVTAPGVPDFYQGTELMDLTLVDPDNRRPVDFGERRRRLEALTAEITAASDLAALAGDLLARDDPGLLKLYVTRQALHFRRRRAGLFRGGDYLALEATGPLAEHLCAFARVAAPEASLTVVPRLLGRRGDWHPLRSVDWADTRLAVPPGLGTTFTSVFTGETVRAGSDASGASLAAGEVLARFPVALLEQAA